eukprot:COSAG06_NODE_4717_length_4014_cov_1.653384_3_plen_185_part_00
MLVPPAAVAAEGPAAVVLLLLLLPLMGPPTAVASMMKALGYAMDDAYLSSLFKKFDQDGDGQISAAEFDTMGQFLGILDAAAPAPAAAPAAAAAPAPAGAAAAAAEPAGAAPRMPEGLSQMQQMAWRKQHGVAGAGKKKKTKKTTKPAAGGGGGGGGGDEASMGMPPGMSKMQQMAWRKKNATG